MAYISSHDLFIKAVQLSIFENQTEDLFSCI